MDLSDNKWPTVFSVSCEIIYECVSCHRINGTISYVTIRSCLLEPFDSGNSLQNLKFDL